MWAFPKAGGSFKAGLVVASLTLFPWKQPTGQLVPISLGPNGASAPDKAPSLVSSTARGRGT